jgi:FAD/FMN-containing dehydrogenase
MTSRRRFLGAASVAAAWPGAALAQPKPAPKSAKPKPEGVLVNDVHAQLSSALVFKILEPDTLDGVRGAFHFARREKRPVCIAGGRSGMGGQEFGGEAVMIDTRKLNKVLDFDAERGLIELEAGVQWPRLYEFLASGQRGRERQWTFAQKPADIDRVTIGGSLSANVHGRGLAMPPLVNDIESFKLVDQKGDLLSCSRSENAELFRLAIGGYGMFGFVYSVTLRLAPRRKLERVVDLRTLDGLGTVLADRFADGFLYGDFQLSTDDKSPEFLLQGVLTCYRAVPSETPLQGAGPALDEKDRVTLFELAHSDKRAAFLRISNHAQATHGQLYWSDEQQMAAYPDNYHREVDRRLKAVRGTEVMTEICCERGLLERFMTEVRQYALREQVEVISATVRLVEQDKESFLAWARKPFACVTFHIHVEHSTRGLIRAGDAFRRLIDIGLRHGGGYFPAHHRHALRRQLDVCLPQFGEFLRLKMKHDPQELFQSDWYRHYKAMFSR